MNTQKQIKSFREQFIECGNAELRQPGELQKFKDHPEMLPAPWHRAAKVVAEQLKEDPDFGLTPLICLRFGGECRSDNPGCRKMRGYKE